MDRERFDPAGFAETVGAVGWIARVVCLDEVDSTNAEALRLAAAGAPAGTVVVADAQTAGRGRLGRTWWSEPGTALLASWLLRPSLSRERAPLLSLVAGVAAARAASAASGAEVRLKWPNDLLVDGGKVGGILAESDGRGAVVVGLGLNVARTEFPDDLRETATSLIAAGGRALERAWLLAATLSGFGARMEEPERALDEYRALCETLGRRVRVEGSDGRTREGTAVDVTDRGTLLLRTDSGDELVAVGDVTHLRARD